MGGCGASGAGGPISVPFTTTGYRPAGMAQRTASSPDSIDTGWRRGLGAIRRWQDHVLADLAWADVDRPSDQLRAVTRRLCTDAASEAIGALATRLGWSDRAPDALTVLTDAGWTSGGRLPSAVSDSQHRVLDERLRAAWRPFGPDPLAELGGGRGRTGALVRETLASQAEGRVALSSEDRTDLSWAAAGALRAVAEQAGGLDEADDAALRDAVAERLAVHDAAGEPATAARRLARRLAPDRLSPATALLAGHTRLAAALLAERIPVPCDRIDEWLIGPDPIPFAVALRAGGSNAAEVGGVLAALAVARGRPLATLEPQVTALRDLGVEAAGALLVEVTG